jgi:hypothetical protein
MLIVLLTKEPSYSSVFSPANAATERGPIPGGVEAGFGHRK